MGGLRLVPQQHQQRVSRNPVWAHPANHQGGNSGKSGLVGLGLIIRLGLL